MIDDAMAVHGQESKTAKLAVDRRDGFTFSLMNHSTYSIIQSVKSCMWKKAENFLNFPSSLGHNS